MPSSHKNKTLATLLALVLRSQLTTVPGLPVFAAAAERFAAHGVRVVVSDETTTTLCNDKLATCNALRARGVAAAASYTPDSLPGDVRYPLFVKPRGGRGSVGAVTVRNAKELAFFSEYVADPVIQEYLDGPEYTIDVLCDFSGRPLAIVPRERERPARSEIFST